MRERDFTYTPRIFETAGLIERVDFFSCPCGGVMVSGKSEGEFVCTNNCGRTRKL